MLGPLLQTLLQHFPVGGRLQAQALRSLPCDSCLLRRLDAAVVRIQGEGCFWSRRTARAPTSALPPSILRVPSGSRARSDRTLSSSGTCKRSRCSLASVSAVVEEASSTCHALLRHGSCGELRGHCHPRNAIVCHQRIIGV